jgi:hypothetical protein
VGAAFPRDPLLADRQIIGDWRRDIAVQLPAELQPPPPSTESDETVGGFLYAWALACTRPVVVFIDEIDALRDDALVSVLRQLRAGYARRPKAFPWSLALVGLRDVRDYKLGDGGEGRLGTASPFNIKVESITLRDFTLAEVTALYQQHTDYTGQAFKPEAIDRAFELTAGQPWLVNALARQAVEVVRPDRTQPVTRATMDAAKDLLIQRQDTHIDSLAERLRQPRVRRVIAPMLAGGTLDDVPPDDIRFVVDLGLCHRDAGGALYIANPIYREVIPRVLADAAIASLGMVEPNWLRADGRIDIERLLESFLAFWRQHGEPLLHASPYHEVAAQVVMMAFLHRVANAGGTIEREYATGMGRMDLCLRYGPDTFAFELKVWRDGRRDPLAEGLAQLDAYLARLDLTTGWLVVFDQRSGLAPIEERTSAAEAKTPTGRRVTVIRG